MITTARDPGKSRLARNVLARQEIKKWFQAVMNNQKGLPSPDQLHRLAEHLKVFLNRANNAEMARNGEHSLLRMKDVSPAQVLNDKTNAILIAAKDYQDWAGNILPTPGGDVDLDELMVLLRLVRSIRSVYRLPSSRGQPRRPWVDAAREFSIVVRSVLIENDFRGPLSPKNPDSIPIVVTAQAISWAYGIRLEPSGLISSLRPRDRRKNSKRD